MNQWKNSQTITKHAQQAVAKTADKGPSHSDPDHITVRSLNKDQDGSQGTKKGDYRS